MSRRLRFFLPLIAVWFAPPVRANDLAYVKCAANQDRVWVYDSPTSFNVEAKLRCGAPVQILSRLKDYVKIRTENGVEGYVPDAAFPDLPAMLDESKQPLATAAARSVAAARKTATPITSAPQSAEVVAARAAVSAPTPSPSAEPAAAAPQPTISTSVPARSVAAAQTAATPITSAPQSAEVVAARAAVSAPTPSPSAEPTAAAPQPAVAASATAPSPSGTALATKPATVSARVSSSSTHAKPSASVPKKAEGTPANPPARVAVPSPNPPAPVAPGPARVAVETVSASARDSAAIVPARALPASNADEDTDEYPDTKPENESADPACHTFFAAYGLAPSQYKWMAESRKKEFSGICPAPDLAHVDYVVLFTHDSESYTYAMPAPVHTDHNGFSDFSPLMTADTALVSSSELDKARYEFAWVFRVARGAFDPAKFSPRRKPQFATSAKGSRASSRAIEDAFAFVENQGR